MKSLATHCSILYLLLNSLAGAAFGFSIKNHANLIPASTESLVSTQIGSASATTETRRQSLVKLISTVSTVGIYTAFPSPTFALEDATNNSNKRVAIIGGSGRTGMSVAETIASDAYKMNGMIMTRSGKDPFQIVKLPPSTKERLSLYPGSVDVRDANGVFQALKESSPNYVVYAASASKQGGNSFDVDDVGVENVALACKEIGARLILISALAVDRPQSKSFQITNTIGGYMDKIMDAKLNGETKCKQILGKNYVIIRPGVLLSGKSKGGASDIELNQGDLIGGGLGRDELAGIVAGAIESNVSGVTVEAYRIKTRTKLQPEFPMTSGNELTASTYTGLFANANSD
ncbi:hypothetical protein CTEN210_17777 [Chaetoceros tenuissimus]|uniref:NAD(P)-binding domain-containing protein n=1 Tax=Chaetoceros tenuissimus TaxID=426638 RepID=A0AAD3DBH5_9STRA|nr:hypothetical protein CTEN210_17777 [Chaetoceros tenuissimus]